APTAADAATASGTAVPRLRAVGLSKGYPGTQALSDVALDILPGEVHCLLGENGAGKSTLVKILVGALRPDEGHLELDGERVEWSSPAHAVSRGVSVIHQELDLIPELTVAQNMYLGREPRRAGLVRGRERAANAAAILERLGCAFGPHARTGSLSLAEQQMTALAKALTVDAGLILMDEPTAALNEQELERLVAVVRDLASEGRSVVFVSHRMREIRTVGDRATVLRDGRRVATVRLEDVSEDDLVRHMIGSSKGGHEAFATSTRRTTARVEEHGAEALLHVRSARIPGVLDVGDLTVAPGELVGITGLVGSGRTTLLSGLFGATRMELDADLDGRPYRPRRPADAIRAGLALVPEERKTAGLLLEASIERNLALPAYERLSRGGVVAPAAVRRHGAQLVEQLGIRCASTAQAVGTLSGGNQQKVVLGKWLGRGARLLLLDEPTRGLDIGAKAAVYHEIRRLAEAGMSAIVASSELTELLDHCDRILVLHEGRLVAEHAADPERRDDILTAAITGGAA
ncbi:sugar ABC transporter ATP-binding protein, partial [Patulibacter sp. S7RM1-6]